MITQNRYKIAQEAERTSHIRKKDINILDRRLTSAGKIVAPYIIRIEGLLANPNAAIIDVGSGPTCLGRFFKTPHKTYVDPLMDFYRDYYKDKLPFAQESNFVSSRAEKLPLADSSFDAALCYNMLDHTFNPPAIINEIKRVLKSGGYLLVGIYTHSAILKNIRTLAEKSYIFKERPHPYSFTINEIKALFTAGFTMRVCDMIKGKEESFYLKRRFYVLILQKA
ncbi:MAG: class I SAM-dependent methyltransferase [Candidatus Omnitrophota bacterium]